MADRIDSVASGLDGVGIGIGTAGNGPTGQVRRAAENSASAATSAAPADSVAITDSARLLASLSATAGVPEINHTRVASLRQAIESGQYSISAERIADGLLAMERSLGART